MALYIINIFRSTSSFIVQRNFNLSSFIIKQNLNSFPVFTVSYNLVHQGTGAQILTLQSTFSEIAKDHHEFMTYRFCTF